MRRRMQYVCSGLMLVLGFVIALHSYQQQPSRWTSAYVNAAGVCSVQLPDGRVLVTGGDGSGDASKSAVMMDLDGYFTRVSPMLSAHTAHACAALEDGRILVAGGTMSGGGTTNVAEIYDPVKDQWSFAGFMTTARAGATATSLANGRVLIAGGASSGTVLSSMELFDPETATFHASTAILSSPRKDHGAALLNNGRVLLAGGTSGEALLDSMDIYDPASQLVVSAGNMSVARSGLSVTRTLDGRVLLAGGLSKSGDVAVAEIYDPLKNSITPAPRMSVARHGHQSLTLKHNNAILIVGGTGGDNAEVYIPWRSTFRKFDDYKSKWAAPRSSKAGQTTTRALTVGNLSPMDAGLATLMVNHGSRSDFPPDMIVFVNGSGFQPGETVNLVITEINGSDDPVTIPVVADASGNIANSDFSPDINDAGISFNMVATGVSSGVQAAINFTDGGQQNAANLDQCGNGNGGGQPCINNATFSNWVNGNLGSSKSLYFEGDSIPYRMILTNLTPGAHTLIIQWDTTKGGKHAIDYLTSWDRSVVGGSSLCADLADLSSVCNSAPATVQIPVDPNLAANGFGNKGTGGGTPIPGVFSLIGASFSGTPFSCPSGEGTCSGNYALSAPYSGDSSTAIAINFISTGPTAVLGWSGHIATRLDWGLANSAISISGSPYHTRLISLDGGGGNQDRSLSADAVVFPGSITIIKSANPADETTSFPFTASPAPLSPFSLLASTDTTKNTKTFGGITTFTTYTINETPLPSGWSFNSVSCGVTSANGGSSSSTGASVSINMAEGENWTCTYTNTEQGSIKVVKNTVGGDGTFNFTSNFGVTSITTANSTGSQTVNNLNAGSNYSISEQAKSGWNEGTFSCDNGTASAIVVQPGQTTTCTITNTKQAGSIKIVKNTVGGDGAFTFTSNFGVSAITTTSGTGSQTVNNLAPGSSYNISESSQTGWDKGAFSCDNGTASAITVVDGQTTTCTITNTKQGAIKIVKNTVGGDGAFNFTSNFGVTSITTTTGTGSQTVNNLTAGSNYSISETAQTGWDEGSFSCDNGTASAITVVAGQTTTCSITNTKQGAIKIVKNTVGGDGTFAFTSNFGVTSITTTTGTGSQTVNNLTAGSNYSIGETAQTGWDEGSFSCDNGTPSAITVVAGQTTTCSITNTKQGAIKIVKNTVGGDGTFAFTSNFGVTSITTTTGTGSQTINNLSVGTGYNISETSQTGWDAGTFSCDHGAASAIAVLAGQTTTCTITNTKQGSIKIVKNTVGGDGTFNFTSNFGVSAIMTTSGSGSQTVNNLSVGTGYNIGETSQTGWDAGTFSCDHGTASAIGVLAGQTTTCTITNTKQGSIKIVKNTVGGEGTFGFNSNFGVSSITTSSGTGNQTVDNLSAGSGYSISENTQTGWDEGTFSCDHGTASAITVLAGQTTTCSITNTKQGAIKIVKNTVGGDGTFNFTSSFGVGSITTSGGTGNQTVNNLSAGSGYSISENAQTGWDEGTFSCDHGTASAITVLAGQTTTCSITNTKQGAIKIVKNTVGGDGTFNFTSSFGVGSISTSGGTGNQTVNNLSAGSGYSISEMAQSGWAPSAWNCTNGVASAITVVAGQTTTCTITNTAQGSIKIVKNTVGGDGTFNFSSNFGVTSITTSGATGSQTVNNLATGSNYSITETPQTGWDEGTFSCTNGTASAITVVVGQTTTCTITNTKQGAIKIVKNTVGGDGTFAFTSNFGVSSITTSGATGSQTVYVSAGSSYSISENGQTGWYEGTFSCTNGTASAINVVAGQTTTCTITNTKQGAIKIVKNTIGGDGTFSFSSNFGVSSIATASGTGNQTVSNLNPGTGYHISETAQTGWDEGTFSCTSGTASAISVVAGQTTTCTITNTKQGAIKIVKNTLGGNGTFSFTSNFGVSSITTTSGTGSQTVNNLSAGSGYTIGENALTGWTPGAFTCTSGTASAIIVAAGQTTTCTITNTLDGKATVIKTVNGLVPGPNDPQFSFDIRTGATPVSAVPSSAGTILEAQVTSAGNGTLNFSTPLVPGATYQMCEMAYVGYSTSLGPPIFAIPDPNGANPAWMCTNFTVSPGQTLVFNVNNVKPSSNGMASTIGFWKNWSSCANSNGKQKPALDETLYTSMGLTPPPYGPGITLGKLKLSDTSSNKEAATDCLTAVNILNKTTVDGKTKEASDPAFNLASQLLAAILNVDGGAAIGPNDSLVISEAEILLTNHNFDGTSKYIAFNASEATLANALASLLDSYNNNGADPAKIPPMITSAASATFVNGTASSFTVAALGVPTPSITQSGALPTGFSFVSGLLSYSGVSSPKKSTSITFTATNASGTFTQTFTIVVQ